MDELTREYAEMAQEAAAKAEIEDPDLLNYKVWIERLDKAIKASLGLDNGFKVWYSVDDCIGALFVALSNESLGYKDKIRIQFEARKRLDAVKSVEKILAELHEQAQKRYVPEAMDAEDIEKVSISGVGTVYLQSDMYVSMVPERREEMYEWLRNTGNGDLIKPTVNGSSLTSLVRNMIKDGATVPADLVNVTLYTKAVIRK